MYGGLPRPDDPWPLFIALVDRIPEHDARDLVRTLTGSEFGVQALQGPDGAQLLRLAYGGEVGMRIILKQSQG
jgi:hypothetical protein